MLLSENQNNEVKSVAILTRNPVVTKLLYAILEDWGFEANDNAASAAVVFAERGLAVPEVKGRIVWFSPMPLADEAYVEIPMSLTRLYHLLEEEFFLTPRRHVRAPMVCDADLRVDGEWLKAELISLSDRGGRLRCQRELPRKQMVTLETRLGERMIRLSAEVLYCIPAGDSPGRELAQVGILFKPLNAEACHALRRYIERCCVERACARIGLSINDFAVSWFDLVKDPWSGLP